MISGGGSKGSPPDRFLGSKVLVFKKSALTFVLLLAACSGGGGAKVELVPVATELRPTPHGYSFANFAASASPEEFVADDLVKMFGSD